MKQMFIIRAGFFCQIYVLHKIASEYPKNILYITRVSHFDPEFSKNLQMLLTL